MANKSAILSVKIVGDSRNLQGALRRASKSVNDEMNKISNAQKRLSNATSAVLRFASSFTKVGLLSAGLLVASANAATLTAGLVSIAGILPVLPGLLAGFAVGAGVAFLALKDIGTVLADLGPAFTSLQDQISAKFWARAEGPIRSLVTKTLPALRTGLTTTASALGGFFAELAGQLESKLTPVLGYLFKPLNESIDIAKGALGDLVEAFVTLGAVGGQYLPALATWFVNISDRFNEFIQIADSNGSLTTWIDNGLFAFQELGRVIGGVGSILNGIFTAAQAAGGATLTALADGLGRVAAVVNGPAFQGGLTTLFIGAKDALANLSVALAPLGDLFVTLAPVLATVLATLGTLAGTVLVTLASVIAQNQPLIQNLLTAFQTLGIVFQVVGTLISQNAELFTALMISVGVLVAAISIATTVTGIFNAVLAINPIAIVVIAVAALVAGIIYLATQTTFFQDTWQTMTSAVSSAWQAFASFVGPIFTAAISIITSAVDSFLGMFGTSIADMRSTWDAGFAFMRSVGTAAIDAITGAFNSVVGAVQNAISWVRNLFNMGGMPGWLKGVLGLGGTGFNITGAFTPVPGQQGIGATGGAPMISMFAGATTGRTTVINNHVTVEFKGVVTDRVGTAREIKRLLADESALVGAV